MGVRSTTKSKWHMYRCWQTFWNSILFENWLPIYACT